MGSLLRLKSGVPGAAPDPGLSLTLLPTEKRFVDVTDLISDAHDSNRITIAVTGTAGRLAASVWLHRTFTPGESGAYVARALKDHFCVETIAADEGAVGTITFTYYTGPNSTGTLVTKTLSVQAAWGAVDSYDLGALSRAMVCGPDIGKWFPDPQNWTVAGSSVIDMVIRPDTGFVPPTYRLTPDGPINGTVAGLLAAAGATNVITLSNGVTGATHVVSAFIKHLQQDVAPPHSADVNVYPLRQAWGNSSKTTGQTIVCEDGYHYDGSSYFDGFGVIAVGTIPRPPGPWAEGDNWTYAPGNTIHPGYYTITSRSPWGADLGKARFSLTNSQVSWGLGPSQRIAGVRVTNCRLSTEGQIFWDRFGGMAVGDNFVVDHNILTPAPGAAFEMRQNASTSALGPNRGNFFLFNDISGGYLVITSLDIKVIGNRFRPKRSATNPFATEDSSRVACCDSDQNVPKCEWAFNFYPGKEATSDLSHDDEFQGITGPNLNISPADGPFTNYMPGTSEVTIKTLQFYGNIILTFPYNDGGTILPGAGELVFWGDIPCRAMNAFQACGNLIVGVVEHGISLSNAGAGFRANYNLIIRDFANFPTGWAYPQVRFGVKCSPTDVEVKNTIVTGALTNNTTGPAPCDGMAQNIPIPGFNPTTTGSITGADAAWQAARLNDALNPVPPRDIAEVVWRYSFKPGMGLDAGCFASNVIIDLERHTVNKVALGMRV